MLSGPPPDPRTSEGRKALISEAFGFDIEDDLPSKVILGVTNGLSGGNPDHYPTTAESILRSIQNPIKGRWPGVRELPTEGEKARQTVASYLLAVAALLQMR